MKFFSRRPSMSVIDKISKKRLCLFRDGVFETDEKSLIKRLKPYFRHEGNGKSKAKAKVLGYWEMRVKAEKLKIKPKSMKKADLVEALKGSDD